MQLTSGDVRTILDDYLGESEALAGADLEEREAAERFALWVVDDLDDFSASREREVATVHDYVVAFCHGYRARAKTPA
jgi:hypothetical protein